MPFAVASHISRKADTNTIRETLFNSMPMVDSSALWTNPCHRHHTSGESALFAMGEQPVSIAAGAKTG